MLQDSIASGSAMPAQENSDLASVLLETLRMQQNMQLRMLELQECLLSGSVNHVPQGVKFPTPSSYTGHANKLEPWLFEVEVYFGNVSMPEERKVGYAASLLRDTALLWWRSIMTSGNGSGAMPWEEFKKGIREQFLPKNLYCQKRDKL